jgi:hypothetical protein
MSRKHCRHEGLSSSVARMEMRGLRALPTSMQFLRVAVLPSTASSLGI